MPMTQLVHAENIAVESNTCSWTEVCLGDNGFERETLLICVRWWSEEQPIEHSVSTGCNLALRYTEGTEYDIHINPMDFLPYRSITL